MKILSLALVLVLSLGLSAQNGPRPGQKGNRPPVVEVTGTATISEAPDQIVFSINLVGKGATLPEAIESATQQVNALKTQLKKSGFDAQALKTSNYNVNEDYEYNSGKRSLKGYRANHGLTMKIGFDKKSVDLFYTAIQESKVLANLNMQFTLSRKDQLKEQLLTLAFDDARRKAETLAMAAGGRLGEVVRIDYGNRYQPGPMNRYSMAMDGVQVEQGAANMEFNPGDISLSDQVSVIFSIEKGDSQDD
jgi:uncharacterized protein YggE